MIFLPYRPPLLGTDRFCDRNLQTTALKSFSKFSFVWKYYKSRKQPLTEARDAEDGHKNINSCSSLSKLTSTM